MRDWHISPGQHRGSATHQLANNKTARSYSQKMRAPPAVPGVYRRRRRWRESELHSHLQPECESEAQESSESQGIGVGTQTGGQSKHVDNFEALNSNVLGQNNRCLLPCCSSDTAFLFLFFYLAHRSLPLSFSLIDSLFLSSSVLSFLFSPVQPGTSRINERPSRRYQDKHKSTLGLTRK